MASINRGDAPKTPPLLPRSWPEEFPQVPLVTLPDLTTPHIDPKSSKSAATDLKNSTKGQRGNNKQATSNQSTEDNVFTLASTPKPLNIYSLFLHFVRAMLCGSCHTVMTQPHTIRCGHHVCKRCMYKLEKQICPTCNLMFWANEAKQNVNLQRCVDLLQLFSKNLTALNTQFQLRYDGEENSSTMTDDDGDDDASNATTTTTTTTTSTTNTLLNPTAPTSSLSNSTIGERNTIQTSPPTATTIEDIQSSLYIFKSLKAFPMFFFQHNLMINRLTGLQQGYQPPLPQPSPEDEYRPLPSYSLLKRSANLDDVHEVKGKKNSNINESEDQNNASFSDITIFSKLTTEKNKRKARKALIQADIEQQVLEQHMLSDEIRLVREKQTIESSLQNLKLQNAQAWAILQLTWRYPNHFAHLDDESAYKVILLERNIKDLMGEQYVDAEIHKLKELLSTKLIKPRYPIPAGAFKQGTGGVNDNRVNGKSRGIGTGAVIDVGKNSQLEEKQLEIERNITKASQSIEIGGLEPQATRLKRRSKRLSGDTPMIGDDMEDYSASHPSPHNDQLPTLNSHTDPKVQHCQSIDSCIRLLFVHLLDLYHQNANSQPFPNRKNPSNIPNQQSIEHHHYQQQQQQQLSQFLPLSQSSVLAHPPTQFSNNSQSSFFTQLPLAVDQKQSPLRLSSTSLPSTPSTILSHHHIFKLFFTSLSILPKNTIYTLSHIFPTLPQSSSQLLIPNSPYPVFFAQFYSILLTLSTQTQSKPVFAFQSLISSSQSTHTSSTKDPLLIPPPQPTSHHEVHVPGDQPNDNDNSPDSTLPHIIIPCPMQFPIALCPQSIDDIHNTSQSPQNKSQFTTPTSTTSHQSHLSLPLTNQYFYSIPRQAPLVKDYKKSSFSSISRSTSAYSSLQATNSHDDDDHHNLFTPRTSLLMPSLQSTSSLVFDLTTTALDSSRKSTPSASSGTISPSTTNQLTTTISDGPRITLSKWGVYYHKATPRQFSFGFPLSLLHPFDETFPKSITMVNQHFDQIAPIPNNIGTPHSIVTPSSTTSAFTNNSSNDQDGDGSAKPIRPYCHYPPITVTVLDTQSSHPLSDIQKLTRAYCLSVSFRGPVSSGNTQPRPIWQERPLYARTQQHFTAAAQIKYLIQTQQSYRRMVHSLYQSPFTPLKQKYNSNTTSACSHPTCYPYCLRNIYNSPCICITPTRGKSSTDGILLDKNENNENNTGYQHPDLNLYTDARNWILFLIYAVQALPLDNPTIKTSTPIYYQYTAESHNTDNSENDNGNRQHSTRSTTGVKSLTQPSKPSIGIDSVTNSTNGNHRHVADDFDRGVDGGDDGIEVVTVVRSNNNKSGTKQIQSMKPTTTTAQSGKQNLFSMLNKSASKRSVLNDPIQSDDDDLSIIETAAAPPLVTSPKPLNITLHPELTTVLDLLLNNTPIDGKTDGDNKIGLGFEFSKFHQKSHQQHSANIQLESHITGLLSSYDYICGDQLENSVYISTQYNIVTNLIVLFCSGWLEQLFFIKLFHAFHLNMTTSKDGIGSFDINPNITGRNSTQTVNSVDSTRHPFASTYSTDSSVHEIAMWNKLLRHLDAILTISSNLMTQHRPILPHPRRDGTKNSQTPADMNGKASSTSTQTTPHNRNLNEPEAPTSRDLNHASDIDDNAYWLYDLYSPSLDLSRHKSIMPQPMIKYISTTFSSMQSTSSPNQSSSMLSASSSSSSPAPSQHSFHHTAPISAPNLPSTTKPSMITIPISTLDETYSISHIYSKLLTQQSTQANSSKSYHTHHLPQYYQQISSFTHALQFIPSHIKTFFDSISFSPSTLPTMISSSPIKLQPTSSPQGLNNHFSHIVLSYQKGSSCIIPQYTPLLLSLCDPLGHLFRQSIYPRIKPQHQFHLDVLARGLMILLSTKELQSQTGLLSKTPTLSGPLRSLLNNTSFTKSCIKVEVNRSLSLDLDTDGDGDAIMKSNPIDTSPCNDTNNDTKFTQKHLEQLSLYYLNQQTFNPFYDDIYPYQYATSWSYNAVLSTLTSYLPQSIQTTTISTSCNQSCSLLCPTAHFTSSPSQPKYPIVPLFSLLAPRIIPSLSFFLRSLQTAAIQLMPFHSQIQHLTQFPQQTIQYSPFFQSPIVTNQQPHPDLTPIGYDANNAALRCSDDDVDRYGSSRGNNNNNTKTEHGRTSSRPDRASNTKSRTISTHLSPDSGTHNSTTPPLNIFANQYYLTDSEWLFRILSTPSLRIDLDELVNETLSTSGDQYQSQLSLYTPHLPLTLLTGYFTPLLTKSNSIVYYDTLSQTYNHNFGAYLPSTPSPTSSTTFTPVFRPSAIFYSVWGDSTCGLSPALLYNLEIGCNAYLSKKPQRLGSLLTPAKIHMIDNLQLSHHDGLTVFNGPIHHCTTFSQQNVDFSNFSTNFGQELASFSLDDDVKMAELPQMPDIAMGYQNKTRHQYPSQLSQPNHLVPIIRPLDPKMFNTSLDQRLESYLRFDTDSKSKFRPLAGLYNPPTHANPRPHHQLQQPHGSSGIFKLHTSSQNNNDPRHQQHKSRIEPISSLNSTRQAFDFGSDQYFDIFPGLPVPEDLPENTITTPSSSLTMLQLLIKRVQFYLSSAFNPVVDGLNRSGQVEENGNISNETTTTSIPSEHRHIDQELPIDFNALTHIQSLSNWEDLFFIAPICPIPNSSESNTGQTFSILSFPSHTTTSSLYMQSSLHHLPVSIGYVYQSIVDLFHPSKSASNQPIFVMTYPNRGLQLITSLGWDLYPNESAYFLSNDDDIMMIDEGPMISGKPNSTKNESVRANNIITMSNNAYHRQNKTLGYSHSGESTITGATQTNPMSDLLSHQPQQLQSSVHFVPFTTNRFSINLVGPPARSHKGGSHGWEMPFGSMENADLTRDQITSFPSIASSSLLPNETNHQPTATNPFKALTDSIIDSFAPLFLPQPSSQSELKPTSQSASRLHRNDTKSRSLPAKALVELGYIVQPYSKLLESSTFSIQSISNIFITTLVKFVIGQMELGFTYDEVRSVISPEFIEKLGYGAAGVEALSFPLLYIVRALGGIAFSNTKVQHVDVSVWKSTHNRLIEQTIGTNNTPTSTASTGFALSSTTTSRPRIQPPTWWVPPRIEKVLEEHLSQAYPNFLRARNNFFKKYPKETRFRPDFFSGLLTNVNGYHSTRNPSFSHQFVKRNHRLQSFYEERLSATIDHYQMINTTNGVNKTILEKFVSRRLPALLDQIIPLISSQLTGLEQHSNIGTTTTSSTNMTDIVELSTNQLHANNNNAIGPKNISPTSLKPSSQQLTHYLLQLAQFTHLVDNTIKYYESNQQSNNILPLLPQRQSQPLQSPSGLSPPATWSPLNTLVSALVPSFWSYHPLYAAPTIQLNPKLTRYHRTYSSNRLIMMDGGSEAIGNKTYQSGVYHRLSGDRHSVSTLPLMMSLTSAKREEDCSREMELRSNQALYGTFAYAAQCRDDSAGGRTTTSQHIYRIDQRRGYGGNPVQSETIVENSAVNVEHGNFLLSNISAPFHGIELEYIHTAFTELGQLLVVKDDNSLPTSQMFSELFANSQLLFSFWLRLVDLYNLDSHSTFGPCSSTLSSSPLLSSPFSSSPLSNPFRSRTLSSPQDQRTAMPNTPIAHPNSDQQLQEKQPSHLYLPTSHYIPISTPPSPNPIITQFNLTTRYLATATILTVEQITNSIQRRINPILLFRDLCQSSQQLCQRLNILSRKIARSNRSRHHIPIIPLEHEAYDSQILFQVESVLKLVNKKDPAQTKKLPKFIPDELFISTLISPAPTGIDWLSALVSAIRVLPPNIPLDLISRAFPPHPSSQNNVDPAAHPNNIGTSPILTDSLIQPESLPIIHNLFNRSTRRHNPSRTRSSGLTQSSSLGSIGSTESLLAGNGNPQQQINQIYNPVGFSSGFNHPEVLFQTMCQDAKILHNDQHESLFSFTNNVYVDSEEDDDDDENKENSLLRTPTIKLSDGISTKPGPLLTVSASELYPTLAYPSLSITQSLLLNRCLVKLIPVLSYILQTEEYPPPPPPASQQLHPAITTTHTVSRTTTNASSLTQSLTSNISHLPQSISDQFSSLLPHEQFRLSVNTLYKTFTDIFIPFYTFASQFLRRLVPVPTPQYPIRLESLHATLFICCIDQSIDDINTQNSTKKHNTRCLSPSPSNSSNLKLTFKNFSFTSQLAHLYQSIPNMNFLTNASHQYNDTNSSSRSTTGGYSSQLSGVPFNNCHPDLYYLRLYPPLLQRMNTNMITTSNLNMSHKDSDYNHTSPHSTLHSTQNSHEFNKNTNIAPVVLNSDATPAYFPINNSQPLRPIFGTLLLTKTRSFCFFAPCPTRAPTKTSSQLPTTSADTTVLPLPTTTPKSTTVPKSTTISSNTETNPPAFPSHLDSLINDFLYAKLQVAIFSSRYILDCVSLGRRVPSVWGVEEFVPRELISKKK